MSSHEVVHGDVARKLHSHSRAQIETYCSIVFAEGKRSREPARKMLMAIAIFVSVTALFTQDRQKPAYLSLDLPAQQRAEVFICRMTVEEKSRNW